MNTSTTNYWMTPEQKARAEADDLRRKLAAAEADNVRLAQRADDAERKARSYGDQAAAAQVDADRKVRDALAQLDRVLAELLRRGIATDLVPDSWRSLDPASAAEAEMRAGWPEDVALTERCRELEEIALAAQRRENEAHRRRLGVERSRDHWIAIALGLGYDMHLGRDMRGNSGGDLVEVASPELMTELLAERSRDRVQERAALDAQPVRKDPEEEVATWRNRANGLARLVRRIPRLPAKSTKLSAGELSALAWAVRPAQTDYDVTAGQPPKLAPEVIADVCRAEVESAVRLHRSHAEILGKTFDADRFRARALSALGVEVEAAGDAA